MFLVISLRQHIRFLLLHDGISLTSEFPGHFDDCLLRVHALTTVGIIASQLIISMDSHPACLYDERAELFVASEGLYPIYFLLARVVACRDKSEDGDKLAFVGETHEIVVILCQY